MDQKMEMTYNFISNDKFDPIVLPRPALQVNY
jgi:hypothetical protein